MPRSTLPLAASRRTVPPCMTESTTLPSGGHIPPSVAQALLESLRVIDTPPEEPVEHKDLPDIAAALPHRLGLSTAVEDQIHRYARRKSAVPVQEVASLIRLIGRRPDARKVFAEAGRRLARLDLEERGLPSRVAGTGLPRHVRHRLALRRLRRLARRLNPDGEVRTERKPPSLVIARCLTARTTRGGDGCALLTGAMTSLLEAYGVESVEVAHPSCEARSNGPCVWKLEDQAG